MLETPHFRVVGTEVTRRRPGAPVDNELADHIVAELGPLGLVPDGRAFERVFADVVLATAASPAAAWDGFYRNTLRRLRDASVTGSDSCSVFARIYAHTAPLVRGRTVLDVGTCFGFLPMLLARADPGLVVVGCDVVPAMAALAASRPTAARFLAGDAHRLPFRPGGVETVVALHVLEHLPAASTPPVLAELCRVAARRVVVAVPLEDVPNPAYGHLRAFDLPELARIGAATGWTRDVHERDGGWLVLDRPT